MVITFIESIEELKHLINYWTPSTITLNSTECYALRYAVDGDDERNDINESLTKLDLDDVRLVDSVRVKIDEVDIANFPTNGFMVVTHREWKVLLSKVVEEI